ncbi:hypothetical protein [Candidatus Thiodictyon syntrophicum]|uniref:Uncharacterized protein n=1 Tax=Candidatus Thiodictyon syntrophicum TaxID=1166950 RepID=A0A2K8UBL3_9GAMM|nr:hypothetical protein [Candidatus Thiodictyon syntrophicum]AUB82968.1 hypothetical protein THSYN_19800 [Candidatus Thiodictyon syntrophicum]
MRIAILPTGRMEWQALPGALGRLFPEHEFYSLPTQEEVESNEAIDFPVPSFTSCDVLRLAGKLCAADKLIERAVAEAIGDRRSQPADLVLIIDDLELDNIHQPAAVVGIIRQAAQRYLERIAADGVNTYRHTEALRERVSFHLAKPMIEAWLFADPAGPTNAGVSVSRIPRLKTPNDPECFCSDDPAFAADSGADCMAWHALPDDTLKQRKKKQDSRPIWLKCSSRRSLHPKAYLAWLCLDGAEKKCSTYSESKGGAYALERIAWDSLLAEIDHCCFVRSMVNDIASCLGVTPAFAGACAPETDLADKRRRNRLLRNV